MSKSGVLSLVQTRWCRKVCCLHAKQIWKMLLALPNLLSVHQPFTPVLGLVHLLTDGSSMLPQELCLRLASWAVTVAVPVGETPPLLASGQLPGLVQTAFRAEIAAALSAMLFDIRAGCALVLYFDCQGVVEVLPRQSTWTTPR